LHVTTCPAEAHVYLDGPLKGEAPMEFDVKPGEHNLSLTKDGYAGRAIRIDAAPDADLKIVAPLAPGPLSDRAARGMQGLFVLTCPDDAAVFVDQAWAGQGAAYLPDLAPGPHKVSVVRPGYLLRNEVVTVLAGGTRTLEVVLDPGQEPGSVTATRLRVETCPVGAVVLVDGRWRGLAPVEVDVTPGQHAVTLALPHYAGRFETVAVAEGTRREIRLPLHRIDTTLAKDDASRLSIATCPVGLAVLVDGTVASPTPMVLTVGPGRHAVGIQSRTSERAYRMQQVIVRPGETLSLEQSLPSPETERNREK
jgi:hypothetical protein